MSVLAAFLVLLALVSVTIVGVCCRRAPELEWHTSDDEWVTAHMNCPSGEGRDVIP